MRNISASARAALYSAQTSKAMFHLLTIEHADMAETVRLVDNLTDVVSRSNTYTAFPFIAALPPDSDGEVPQVDIVCDAVDRSLIIVARSISTPATVTIEVVVSDSPDTVEAGPYIFDLVGIQYDAKEIRFSLAYEPLATEPYPSRTFSPTLFPLLFNAV